jgi:hypothetical protein
MFDGRIPHHNPHYAEVENRYWCEFERTLKGEYCTEIGEVRLDGLRLCNRHVEVLRLEERATYWRAILAHVELWSGEARRQERWDIVGLLEIERSRTSAALERASAELEGLEESGRGEEEEDGWGDGRDGRGPSLW